MDKSISDDQQNTRFWIDIEADTIHEQFPEGELVIASGHSPSGRYHFGTVREPLTAHVITERLRRLGRQTTHIDFVDDLDVLRKIPAGVDSEFEQYLGMPLCMAPSPEPGYDSYAEYYLRDWLESYAELGIDAQIYRSHEQYQAGNFTGYIEAVLDNLDEVKEIIQRVSKRQLPKNWVPVQLLSDDNFLNTWTFTGWDASKQTILYTDEHGREGELQYAEQPGRVKLDWRLDWPARWHMLGVNVEPFGRDHAAKGGSYDTGQELVRRIFDGQAPHPIRYEFINIAGQTKKMSKSAGNVITPSDMLRIMPSGLFRYFIVKSRPDKQLEFDPGEKLMALYDEYKDVTAAIEAGEGHEFEDAYRFADMGDVLTGVPFNHLASVYQAARRDSSRAAELLKRTGYDVEREALEAELYYVENWLDMYAPGHLKFELQEELPEVKLGSDQVVFLTNLARFMEDESATDPETIHTRIHELKDAHNLSARDAFQAIYLVLLGQTSGPKAGWYLTTLDKDWLVKRLNLEE